MIDKVKAMNLISRNKSVFQYDEEMTEALNLAIKVLEERPQGEWIEGEYMDCYSYILPIYICPFCGEVECRKYNFCHCGADMRGDSSDNKR